MRRTHWAALAAFILLCIPLASAKAGGYDKVYAGADLYVARTHAPVYDCPRPGCRTDIRLRNGSYIYAICWDGGEGWCRIQTRYFRNMFLPRYALDLANGGHQFKSYYYKEGYAPKDAYPPKKADGDCYYRERYPHAGGYKEGCYEKESYAAKSYGPRSYGPKSYEPKSYAYKPSYPAKPNYAYRYDAYPSGGYTKEYGYSDKRPYRRDEGYAEDEAEVEESEE